MGTWKQARPLVLASESQSRRRALTAAGIQFACEPARIDETAVKRSLLAEKASVAQIAETLAELKAKRISLKLAEALVIGADQVLECDGRLYDKPTSPAEARDHLTALSGRTHRLWTSACLCLAGERIWHCTVPAELTIRPLNEEFIEYYLDQVGEAALTSVGAYQLEGLGVQLLSRIQGDFFTILGLPLLELLAVLREHDVVMR